MSQSEVERFVADLKSDDALRTELSEQASGVASVVTFAANKDYDVTSGEVSAYIQGQVTQELTDGQLDAIVGGKGHHHHSTSTQAVQTVEMVTTQTIAAETTAEVVAVVIVT